MSRLPIIEYEGKRYFVDIRLMEFRSVQAPIEFVPFDSEKGWALQDVYDQTEDDQDYEESDQYWDNYTDASGNCFSDADSGL